MSKIVSIIAAVLMLAGTLPASIVHAGGLVPYFELVAPDVAPVGARPMQLAVVVNNPSSEPVFFDGFVWHELGLVDTQNVDRRFVHSPDTDNYYTTFDDVGRYEYWRGSVERNSSKAFSIQTTTGLAPGNFLVKAGFMFTGQGPTISYAERRVPLTEMDLPMGEVVLPPVRSQMIQIPGTTPTVLGQLVVEITRPDPIIRIPLDLQGSELTFGQPTRGLSAGSQLATCTMHYIATTPDGKLYIVAADIPCTAISFSIPTTD